MKFKVVVRPDLEDGGYINDAGTTVQKFIFHLP